ncbi:cytochrome P450 [Pholiota conissans]|uniref:Cytochrome P450 n=1 Tax=Pholiota conissans TaxID=109636 RepID=A0A9P5Z805_9AGAR|nr:cytochrome P450 [Pholiota conissans]
MEFRGTTHPNAHFVDLAFAIDSESASLMSTISVYILLILLASYLLFSLTRRQRNLPLPPGPPGYHIIGNVHDIPHQYAWLTYAKWAKQYGDIVYYNVFGKVTIVLNSLEAATELLDKRSSNYSDRPRMVMANELMDWDWDFAHMAYTDRWRRHRRMFHQYFQPRNLASYYPIQKKMTIKLLDQLVQSPENFASHIQQLVSSVVLQAAYGYEVKEENDFYVNLVHTAVKPLLLVVHASGKYLVEFLPALKHVPAWVPGTGFKRDAKIWAQGTRDLRDLPFEMVKKSMAEGVAEKSFVLDNLEKMKADTAENVKEVEETIKNCAGIIFLAGSDTTSALLLAWVLAMVHYPEVQGKAQKEIDKALGGNRLPEFADRDSTPFIEATLLETMRWHAITPLALPHRAMREDEYKGYRIPAGATITPNAWAILHDEELYPEPHRFNPERFLKDGAINFELQPDPVLTGGFGYGRRVCPGRHLATNTAWIAMTSILATYNISKAVDDEGVVIEPSIAFTDGLVSHAKPYQVQFTPRSTDVYKLIDNAKAENSI